MKDIINDYKKDNLNIIDNEECINEINIDYLLNLYEDIYSSSGSDSDTEKDNL